MCASAIDRRPLSSVGLTIPPIVFGTAALGNAPHVIPEGRKVEICAEWFRHLDPPVFVDANYQHGDGLALEVLGRMLRRMDIRGDEVVVHLTLDGRQFIHQWEKSCRLLGDDYRPKLVSISDADEAIWRTAGQLKMAGLLGVGLIARDLESLNLSAHAAPGADWVVLTGGFTLMRHSPGLVRSMSELSARQIPLIVSGIFDGGFLLGSNRLDGRVLRTEEPAHRSFLAWRTSFAALCHGHGISPAHACIEFALSGPGVVAVLVNSSHPDRVAENVASAQQKAPGIFWDSMKEEGLLAVDHPHLGSSGGSA